MNCEFDYCLYNRDSFCLLKEVQINPLGMCDECMMVSVPADILNELKKKQLAELDGRWKEYEYNSSY